jgi:hypothetical protein
MPLSTDPEKRETQLANLRKSEGAVKHGATSERKIAPLRAKHRADLLTRFPRIDEHRLRLLSDLLARIDLASEFVDVHGLMRNTRETHPVLELLTRWERRAWDMLSQLAPANSGGAWNRDTPELRFELTAAERIGIRAADPKTQIDAVHAVLVRISDERQRGRATSLRHTSLNMETGGQAPKKLRVRDLAPADLALLDELSTKSDAERAAVGTRWDLKKLTDEQLATLEELAAIATAS